MANEYGLLNAAEAEATAEKIKAKLVELAVKYNLPTDSNGLPRSYANEAVARALYDLYHQACELAHSYDKTFMATVVPGFNNTAISDTNGSEALKVVDRLEGACYSLLWQVAKSSHPDGYAVTSFNEWHEGTEIEPSFEYRHLYISLTRSETVPVSLSDLSHAYESKPGDPRWNPAADLNRDGKVNLLDLVILAKSVTDNTTSSNRVPDKS